MGEVFFFEQNYMCYVYFLAFSIFQRTTCDGKPDEYIENRLKGELRFRLILKKRLF